MVSGLGKQHIIIQVLFRVLYNMHHHLQRLKRIFSGSSLPGEHHRVRAVIDRIGNIRHFRSGRTRIPDHRIQHLGSCDYGFKITVAFLNQHFLETGGTLEEWAAHNIKIIVDYEIKQQSNDYLSFVVRGSENWTNAYGESQYYNLDLNTGKIVTLKDILGNDYVELVNRSIREQIAERQRAGETFFTAEEGGFAGISEDVKFYINGNNYPVIVFEKYEIAPGSSGEVEFEITGGDQQDPATEMAEEETTENPAQISERYEDNFAVDSEAAKEFARQIKDATAQKDLEAFAELTAFPVYVGLPGVDVVETKEDFLKLGADAVFTEGLLKSVEEADIDHFQPSMAGFSVSDGGTANINFSVSDGVLAINGINY